MSREKVKNISKIFNIVNYHSLLLLKRINLQTPERIIMRKNAEPKCNQLLRQESNFFHDRYNILFISSILIIQNNFS